MLRVIRAQPLESVLRTKPVYRLFFNRNDERPVDVIRLADFENGFVLFMLDAPLNANPAGRFVLVNRDGEIRLQAHLEDFQIRS